jgi:hypothetical protein
MLMKLSPARIGNVTKPVSVTNVLTENQQMALVVCHSVLLLSFSLRQSFDVATAGARSKIFLQQKKSFDEVRLLLNSDGLFFLIFAKKKKKKEKKLQFVFNDSSRGNRGLTTISIQGNIFWQFNPTQFL